MKHDPYSSKCDIWSLGVVIYELTALEYPFKAKDVAGLKIKAEKGEYSKLPDQTLARPHVALLHGTVELWMSTLRVKENTGRKC